MVRVVRIGGYQYIDNGIFYDGRAKTFQKHGLKNCVTTWSEGREKPKETQEEKTQKTAKAKERLERAAKGTKSITAFLKDS